MFNIKTIIAALLLYAWSLAVISNDKIYKITTDDGRIIYTDSPMEQGEHVPLSADSVMTLKSASLSPITTPPIIRKQTKEIHLSVISPKPEQTIRDNSGKLTIRTALEPQVQGVYRCGGANGPYSSGNGTRYRGIVVHIPHLWCLHL